MTQIHLGGGGSEHDEAALWDEVFVPGRRVSLWPFATPTGAARDGSVGWFTRALRERGEFTLDVWGLDGADGSERTEDLHLSQVVAIPGGNTFDLLHHLRQHDLLQALNEFLDGGGRVYGGSAGAVLLGADITIAEGEDPDDVGVTDTRGLDRVGGAVVRPHYTDALDADLQRWAREHDRVVLALPERSGVVIEGRTARNVGPEPVVVFTPNARLGRPAGSVWDFGER